MGNFLIKFWLPIILGLITIVTNYFNYKWTDQKAESKIDKLVTKLDTLSTYYLKKSNGNASLNARINSLNDSLSLLDSNLRACKNLKVPRNSIRKTAFNIDKYLASLIPNEFVIAIGDYYQNEDLRMSAWWEYLQANGYSTKIFKYDAPSGEYNNSSHSRIYVVGFSSMQDAERTKENFKAVSNNLGFDINIKQLYNNVCKGTNKMERNPNKPEYFKCSN